MGYLDHEGKIGVSTRPTQAHGNAHVGVLVNGLYGHRLNNGQFDNNGVFAIQVGTREQLPNIDGPVYSSEIIKPYFEQTGYRHIGLLNARGFTVSTPLWQDVAERHYCMADSEKTVGVIIGDFDYVANGGRGFVNLCNQVP